MEMNVCPHIEQLKSPLPEPRTPDGCEECLKTKSWWVHLRLCETCGHVGCCDNSPNRHATKHFHETQHPVIKSFEPGEEWAYCYPDNLFYQTLPSLNSENKA